ncbi:(2Fe-2S)-binding protein [Mycolicibacterium litorale]|uniref:(2Fe-2S)-binding protein n=1 Tax=Mycolicibacterium litorale TaxID=758802 RepID=UPI003CF8B9DA
MTDPSPPTGGLTFRATINGKDEELDVAPLKPLADVLRDDLDLTGTKLGCRAGECGSCTVLVDGVAVASCLLPAAKATGTEIVTIEGLSGDRLRHPLQEAFRRNNASQCGFCIPGILMASVALATGPDVPTRQEVAEGLAGNLCRCTGYESIVTAVQEAAAAMIEPS